VRKSAVANRRKRAGKYFGRAGIARAAPGAASRAEPEGGRGDPATSEKRGTL